MVKIILEFDFTNTPSKGQDVADQLGVYPDADRVPHSFWPKVCPASAIVLDPCGPWDSMAVVEVAFTDESHARVWMTAYGLLSKDIERRLRGER